MKEEDRSELQQRKNTESYLTAMEEYKEVAEVRILQFMK